MKTRREIIDETAAFYNSSNRSTYLDERCMYLNPDGKMCAVGRCIRPEMIKTISDKYDGEFIEYGANAHAILNNHGDNILKPEYRGHSSVFWVHLQSFHDVSDHWDENGLTEQGKRRYNFLIQEWGESID